MMIVDKDDDLVPHHPYEASHPIGKNVFVPCSEMDPVSPKQ